MRAIALSVVIALALACFNGAPLLADAHSDVIQVVSSLADGLTGVNVPEFMDVFDKEMPGYDTLRAYVTALTNQAEVNSSIEPVQETGDNQKRSIELDWYLEVRSLLQDGPIVQRREVIHCELEKEGRKWKIVSIKPLDFFAPPKLDQ